MAMSALVVGSLAFWVGKPDARRPAETVMVTNVLESESTGCPPIAYEVRFMGSNRPQWVSPYALVELREDE